METKNNLFIKRLRPNALIPRYMTEGSAAMDLYSCIDEDIIIPSGSRALIPTGIAVMIEKGFAGLIYARSGLASKYGITLSNCVGVIDSDYRGEIMVSLINLSDTPFTVTDKMRIAQMAISPVASVQIIETDELCDTHRGKGGFGSTGV